MKIVLSPTADKQLRKLPKNLNLKFTKQLTFLIGDPAHPSLRNRKMTGNNRFEARIDRHYRFSYTKNGEIIILSIGPHDEGLGKK